MGDRSTLHPPTSTRMPERTSSPSHGSRTVTIDPAQEDYADENNDSGEDDVGILRLRGDMSARRPRAIQWDESVVDNEHMNKKKSKSKYQQWESYNETSRLTRFSLLYISSSTCCGRILG